MLTLFPRIRPNPIPPPPPPEVPAAPSDEVFIPPQPDLLAVVVMEANASAAATAKTGAEGAPSEATAEEIAETPEIAAAPDAAGSLSASQADLSPESVVPIELASESGPQVLAEIPFVSEISGAEPSAESSETAADAALEPEESVLSSPELAVQSTEEPVLPVEQSDAPLDANESQPSDSEAPKREANHAAAAEAAILSEALDIGEWEDFSETEPATETADLKQSEMSSTSEPGAVASQTELAAVNTSADPGVSKTLFEVFSSAFQAADTNSPAEAVIGPSLEEVSAASAAPEPELVSAEPSISAMNVFDEIEVLQEAAQPTVESSLAESTPGDGPATNPSELGPAAQPEPVAAEPAASRDEAKARKGSFFVLPRVPEPEIMEDPAEVEAYASAAAQSYLDGIDDTFVAHAQLLLKGRERGRALDIGTGPGQIAIKLGYRLMRWKFVGVDRSAAMIEKARESLATAPELAGRVEFLVADGSHLDFPSRSFDLVYCNSVLHHLADPQKLFSEMARLVKPGGAILLRDLRRPSRLGFGHHVRKHGKHYSGEMKRLYLASLRAAYTEEELQQLVSASALRGVTVFRHAKTHIGFARPIETPPARPA